MINYILEIVNIFILWLVLGQLKLIASDTQKKEDLNDALEKFAALYVADKEKKKKVVAFRVKDEEE